MRQRGTVLISDVPLVIGLVAGVASLLFIAGPRPDPGLRLIAEATPLLPAANLGVAALPTSPDAEVTTQGAPADSLDSPPRFWPAQPGRQGDLRITLREAADMARWYPGVRPWQGETRTDLWVNAPTSIGSTSPPAPVPATPLARE
ncbi:MAG: hypothetical protein KC442_10730 [Thermomicrobiales bacterium]|nr:hypothetical protein [Thermomicrobiales bacterium]